MLYGTVTNERQRHGFQHGTGPLNFGRLKHEELECVVIDDAYVSRDQLQIEDIGDERIRLDNRGRSTVFFRDGTRLLPNENGERALPIHLTIGQTVIEVSAKPLEDPRLSGIRNTIQIDSFSDVALVTLDDSAHGFPFPLATGYRQLNSCANSAERYKELLRQSENILAFLGSLSLALIDDSFRAELASSLGRSPVEYWRGGISPGHWLELTIHTTRLLQKQNGGPLAKELAGLDLNRENRGLGKTLRALIKAKNDHKHDRGPSIDSEYQTGCVFVSSQLDQVFQSLSFLKQLRLLLVRDINPHRRGDKADVVFLRCMGSNPGFLTEQWVHAPNLVKGDLYFERDLDDIFPLYPFLQAKTCTQCKRREFYFMDRLDTEGRRTGVTLKSFDRGHTETDTESGREAISLLTVE